MNRTLAAAGMAMLLSMVGCSQTTEPTVALVLEVAEVRVSCMTWTQAPSECFLTRQGTNGEMDLFYEPILGFDYEPGYRYRLVVTRTTLSNPPADASSHEYRLERVLSRTPSPRPDLLAETGAAEARWIAARPPDYEIVERLICFCAAASIGAVRLAVTVEHHGEPWAYGQVESVQRVEDGAPVPQELRFQFLSVPYLFRAIRWAIAEDAHRIDVEFDEVAGYPRHVSIDPSAEIADDEVEYVVESITEP